jgi:hypothetical protein
MYFATECFTFPFLNTEVGLEVIQIIYVQCCVFLIDFGRAFLASMDNLIDIGIDEKTATS